MNNYIYFILRIKHALYGRTCKSRTEKNLKGVSSAQIKRNANGTGSSVFPLRYLPYNWKLSWVKTFPNLVVLTPRSKVLSATFCAVGTGKCVGGNLQKFHSQNALLLTISWKFLATRSVKSPWVSPCAPILRLKILARMLKHGLYFLCGGVDACFFLCIMMYTLT